MTNVMAYGCARKIIFPGKNTGDGIPAALFLCLPKHYPVFTEYTVYRYIGNR